MEITIVMLGFSTSNITFACKDVNNYGKFSRTLNEGMFVELVFPKICTYRWKGLPFGLCLTLRYFRTLNIYPALKAPLKLKLGALNATKGNGRPISYKCAWPFVLSPRRLFPKIKASTFWDERQNGLSMISHL